MKYIYTKTPIEKSATYTSNRIINHLANGERVLWLLSGGSGLAIAISACKQLQGINLSNLIVTMTDERYGLVGHKDENWQQLLDAGFKLPGATLYRPLTGKDIQTTTSEFNDWMTEQFYLADYVFGIFGMGADGHTAGIKPRTMSVTSTDMVTYEQSDYLRITITFVAIQQINEAVIQISGSEKRPALHDIIYKNTPLYDQPAQILKAIPQTVLYTNNQREEL